MRPLARRFAALLWTLPLLGLAGPGAALDPARRLDQFRHTRWSLGDGAPGNIRAMAQGRDGFLWLGTSTGLYRFDGIRFERVNPVDDDPGRSIQVTALLAARNGDIWVGYDFGGIAVLRGSGPHRGVLRGANPRPPSGGVDSIRQGRDGAVWIAVDRKGVMNLSRYLNGRWTYFGPAQGFAEAAMGSMLSASDGSFYVAQPSRVLRLAPGASRFEPLGARAGSFAALAEDSRHRIWLADEGGLRNLSGGGPIAPLSPVNTPYVRRQIAFDRGDALWIAGQDDGLARVVPSTAAARPVFDRLSDRDGLTASLALSVLEDREGNVWVGTESGLDRFSASNVARPRNHEAVVTGFVADPRSGHVFYAGLSGVYRAGRDREEPELIFRKASLGVLCGDARRLLAIGLDGNYLLTLRGDGTVAQSKAIAGPLSVSCTVDDAGTFWTGMDRVYRLSGARLEPASGPAGDRNGTVLTLRPDGPGTLLVGRSKAGFQRIAGGSAISLWPAGANRIGSVNLVVGSGGSLLFGGQKGIARLRGTRLESLSERDYPVLAGVTGIGRTGDGAVWTIGATGIARIQAKGLDRAFQRPGAALPFDLFGHEEGFRARSNVFGTNDLAADGGGRLWLASNQGLAWIDTERLTRNDVVPPVMIRSLIAGKTLHAPSDSVIALPVGTDRVEIEFAALSLTDAGANRYRYVLRGADGNWVDAGHQRQALYTNLGPGNYEFRVIASNNDGVWNRQGAKIAFTIAPAFYQTGWFLALACLAIGAVVWAFYRWRLRTVAAQASSRLEARLSERERIARELHDTLLQGFQGLMLRFQSIVELLPKGDKARSALEDTLERADDVLLEGRDRVRSLREDREPVPLAPLLAPLAARIVPSALRWTIVEEGSVRPIRASVADELARIVGEALANAVRHAEASSVEIRIRYGADKLTLSIADDGIGLPDAIREAGRREGHYGLVGMRERAVRLGGTLEFRARQPHGTEVFTAVPSRLV